MVGRSQRNILLKNQMAKWHQKRLKKDFYGILISVFISVICLIALGYGIAIISKVEIVNPVLIILAIIMTVFILFLLLFIFLIGRNTVVVQVLFAILKSLLQVMFSLLAWLKIVREELKIQLKSFSKKIQMEELG